MDCLYLSFWDVALSNFSIGTFRKRMLSNAEARGLIARAREAGALVCVAEADLAAPYGEREREKHRQLCEALRRHADIRIDLKDFFGEQTANGLFFVEIGEGASFLVVDCAYTMELAARGDPSADDVGARERNVRLSAGLAMNVSPDSIAFHLFEQVGPVDVGRTTG